MGVLARVRRGGDRRAQDLPRRRLRERAPDGQHAALGRRRAYGLDISPELTELARTRYPHWHERIFVGNAIDWTPPHRFDAVRTGLEYVPAPRRRALVAHLLENVVASGGRLIVGKFNEEVDERRLEAEVASWGLVVAGRAERAHRFESRLVYRTFWIDRAV